MRSLREIEWREEKERRGGSLDEVGVWVTVSPKEEKEGGGVQYGEEGVGSRADRKGSTQYTRTASVAQCHGHTRIGGGKGPDTDGVRRVHSEMTQHA